METPETLIVRVYYHQKRWTWEIEDSDEIVEEGLEETPEQALQTAKEVIEQVYGGTTS